MSIARHLNKVRVVAIALLLSVQFTGLQAVYAKNKSVASLSDIFIFERDSSGVLVKVKVNRDNLKIETLIEEVKKDLTSLEKSTNKDARSYLDLVDTSDWTQKDVESAEAVLNKLKNNKTSRHFSDAKFKKVTLKFQKKIFDRFNSNLLAAPSNPKYFYETEIIEQLTKLGLDIINSTVLPSGIHDLAFYILKKAIDLDSQRRAFYQHALLYALENAGGEGLGLSELESTYVLSSIYESRIKWYEVWKTRNARRHWGEFGLEQFAKSVDKANERWSEHAALYTGVGSAFNYAFIPVNYKGKSVVINTNNGASLLSGRPSVAMNNSEVDKLFVERVVLTLLEFAVEITPLPGIGQSALQKFLRSQYFSQVKTEGALWAHYLESNHSDLSGVVIRQTVNPFIAKDFR